MGEVSVLGVKIGMKEETAAKIQKPESSCFWVLKENVQKDYLGITNYQKDEKINIGFCCYEGRKRTSDKIISISISRALTKDKLERDEALKYYTDKFKPYLKETITKTRQYPGTDFLYDTGLNKVKISAGQWKMNNESEYGILIVIEEKTRKECVKANVIKSKNEGMKPQEDIGRFVMIFFYIIVPFALLWFFDFMGKTKEDYKYAPFAVVIILSLMLYYKHKKHSEEYKEREYFEKSYREECEKNKNQKAIITFHQAQETLLRNQIDKLTKLLNSKSPFKDVVDLTRDCFSAIFENEEHYLRYKSRPAIKSAELVKELKAKYNQMGEEYLLMKYRYDFLLKMFPDLIKYIEDDGSAVDAIQATSIEKFQEEYDHSRDYLTEQEYRSLSVDERNQLALDRYKERRRKSSWIAGVEYEMYYCYLLRMRGYDVIDFGVQKGLDDLGRDIIATKNDNTYIIQCKRYSQHKEVHENVICQLYGTTLHYKITERERDIFAQPENIHPVLVTTGVLSETAKEFAEKLWVQVMYVQMGEYPMIKCNINNGNKIYHLPFDQQYWRTVIDKSGEFYAMTVEEATKAGFRRAFRHYIK